MNRTARYSIMFFFFVLIVGCAHSEILPDDGNDSLSQIENHRTALEPDLLFLGKVKIAQKAGWDNILRGASLEDESLVYGHVSNSNVIEKGLIVRTYELLGESGTLLEDLLAENNPTIESGTMGIAGRNAAYELYAGKDILERNEKRLMESKGLIAKDCYFVKEYRLNLKGLLSKSRSQILFFDALETGDAGPGCMRLADDGLTEKDTRFLSGFNRQADAYLKILLEGKPSGEGPPGEKAGMESEDHGSVPGTTEIERKLSTLKKLLDRGLITQGDYERKKAELLEEF